MNTSIPGLRSSVSLQIDRWGVTHIRAENDHDLYLAQGYNAARERLWQMDLWRKRGLGLLAADFGPGYLEQDRASRLTLYRGPMADEWAAYSHPDAKAIATAFVKGINAYIDAALADDALLPVEFHQMGTRPLPWHADDVVRIRNSVLMRNAESELLRGLIMRDGSAALDLFRRAIDPSREPRIPDGLDLTLLREDALDDLKLARAPVTFSAERLACPLSEAGQWRKLDAHGEVMHSARTVSAGLTDATTEADPDGSNNWALHGSRTASGRPIMASDPHRAYAMPSLRYLVHLTAPGIDVIGAGEPTQPGVCIGHNGRFAFSLTMLMMDQEDTLVYALSADDPELYRYGDGWERLRCIDEVFEIKGASAQTITLRFTRHGAVLLRDPATKTAFAVRTVLSEPGGSAYFNSVAIMTAPDYETYRTAMGRWSVPAVNHLYADMAGRIAHVAAGKWPKRTNWDGLLPIPGNGQYEWDGFHSPETLPVEVDPDSGLVASANEWVFADSHDHEGTPFSLEFAESSRARRIRETLDATQRAGRAHDVGDSARLQNDVLSLPAVRMTRILQSIATQAARVAADADMVAAEQPLALLLDWDGQLTRTGAAPALFETWWSDCLKPALFDEAIARYIGPLQPEPVKQAMRKLLPPGDTATILLVLEQPEMFFGTADGGVKAAVDAERAIASRNRLLLRTLSRAMTVCVERFGDDPSAWRWGDHHHAYFAHPLSTLYGTQADSPREQRAVRYDVGPLPLPGSGATVAAAAYRLSDGRANFGASARLVMDIGDWDRSLAINAPGQSGRPDCSHYADLASTWANGDYFPLCYTRAAVDDATVETVRLTP